MNKIRNEERRSVLRDQIRKGRETVIFYEARALSLQGALDVGADLSDDEVWRAVWAEVRDAGAAAVQMARAEQEAVNEHVGI